MMWPEPTSSIRLAGDEVHVWRAALDVQPASLERFWSVLSADERTRADRFHFQKDRDHFVVARGILRTMLGYYCREEPDRLLFSYGPHGKPVLVSDSGVCFNLSHSEGLALYAAARGREVGIDIEVLRHDFPHEQIAERFFSRREISEFLAVPRQTRSQAFFNCWTRKEAYIKAKGDGLSFPLDQFDVSLTPGEPAVLLNVNGDHRELCRWSLQELEPASGYAAALVVEGHNHSTRCWQWPETSLRHRTTDV